MKDNAKSVVLLYKYVRVGGVATYLKTLSRLLNKDGYTVYVATIADENNKTTRAVLEQEGVQIIPIKFSPNRLVLLFRFLKEMLNKHTAFHFDIIHSHHRLTHLVARLFSLFKQIPLLLTVHEFKTDQKLTTRLWKNEHITVPSKALKNHLINEYGVSGNNIHVIPNAIEQEYVIDDEKVNSLRKQMFNDKNAIYVSFIGRIAEEKGVDVIIESIPLVKEQNSNIYFRIIGSGPLLEEAEHRCRKKGINPEEIFVGVHRAVNELLYLTDIAISPSRSESFSIFALETMRASKPLIASRVGGLPEVVAEGESGLLIEPDNPEELAKAILELSKSKTLREGYGAKGRTDFESQFSPRQFIRDYQRIYGQLTNTHE